MSQRGLKGSEKEQEERDQEKLIESICEWMACHSTV